MKTHEVTLEILRHGKPHNQLLSPLTKYLALTGRREAVTVRVDMEHRDMLTYMRSLRYSADDNALRQIQLGRLGTELGNILGAVPGLLSDLSGCSGEELVHLRIISSAAELSLLPFELIDAPQGFPGEGYPICLQFERPLVITREVRGAFGQRYDWPTRPRILFAAAAPPGVGSVPFEAHLLALTSAVIETGAKKTSDVLVKVLPQASLDDIRAACREQPFTHVHILAHGISYEASGQHRFGLALNGSSGTPPVDRVSAERLVSAIHPHAKTEREGGWRSRPTVVSIASCDSGNQAQVIVPGGSIAHALHIAGVPLVVASQFPLTKRGSVEMTETLYTGLLAGDDPRKVLHDVRHQLRAERGEHHDWASPVAYTSLPQNIEQQLNDTRYASAKRGIEAAMRRFDRVEEESIEIEDIKLHLNRALRHAERMPGDGQYRTEAMGMRASTKKRASESLFKIAGRLSEPLENDLLVRSIELLRSARGDYRKAAMDWMHRSTGPEKAHLHWVLCQFLALEVILGRELDTSLWTIANTSAGMVAKYDEQEDQRAWALGTLVELALLRVSSDEEAAAAEETLVLVDALVAMNVADRFIYYSTERQLRRYVDWWGAPSFTALIAGGSRVTKRLVDTAKVAIERIHPAASDFKVK